MLKEFKNFILRGNVVDMAVGITVGAAFTKIVTSLVNDVIMPPIGMILGKIDFTELYINLSDKSYESLKTAEAAGAATINYGLFINNLLNFLIIGLAIFYVVRLMNKLHIDKPKTTAKDIALLTEIRDLLLEKTNKT